MIVDDSGPPISSVFILHKNIPYTDVLLIGDGSGSGRGAKFGVVHGLCLRIELEQQLGVFEVSAGLYFGPVVKLSVGLLLARGFFIWVYFNTSFEYAE